jgi:nucleoside-diphosphate-sugar epimerase
MSSHDILIVGGSGFIGNRLTNRLLAAGHRVRIYDKLPSTKHPELSIIGDVRDRDALVAAAAGADTIYNLAAEHRDDVRPISLYDEVNVGGAENVVAAAESNGINRIVFTSTVAVYPFSPVPLDETAKPAPFNDYGRTKLLAEDVHDRWQAAAPDRTLVTIRPTAVFGEDNRGNVYNLIRQIATGRFVMVGDGTNRKSIAYIENVAAAHDFALTLDPARHLFIYADQPDFDMNTLVGDVRESLGRSRNPGLRLPKQAGLILGSAFDLLARLFGRSFPISRIRIEKFCANTRFDSTRIMAAGFTPAVDIREALKRTVVAEFGTIENSEK